MLEERVLYLINAEIDGQLAAAERPELEASLRSSAEARAMHAELRKLANAMEAMPQQAPPADLTRRILQQIRLPARRPVAASRFSLAGLLASFQPAQAGLAFATGLLLTVGAYEATSRSGQKVDLSQVVGTMVANPAGTATQQTDNLSIWAPGLSGTVSLSALGEFMLLNFDLESAQETEILVGLAETGFGFGGIAHTSAAGTAVDESYEVSGGALRVMNPGSHPFVVFLQRSGADAPGAEAIAIEVMRAGERVFEGSVRIERQGG
jgi:hypothetical protein